MMQKGTKGIMYIPSTLGYGARGAGGDIPPNTNLVFEVEVLSVLSKAQVVADNAVQEKKMKLLQKKYMDSLQKTDPKAAAEMKNQMMQRGIEAEAPAASAATKGTKTPIKKPTTSKTITKPTAIKKTVKKK
jgi:FKBP-type peptidyl-prolyl cis-trans isomerase